MAVISNRDMDISRINVDAVSKIEDELEPCDIAALVFLLFEIPESAFEKLILLQRLGKHNSMLRDWAIAKTQGHATNWKDEFLEALSICRLYGVIRKLGFNVASLKGRYSFDNPDVTHVDLMKKCMYRLSENITAGNLIKLREAFLIEESEYESCELIFLNLMRCGKITVNHNKTTDGCHYKIEELARIIEVLPGLHTFAKELRDIERISSPNAVVADMPERCGVEHFKDEFQLFENMDMEGILKENALLADSVRPIVLKEEEMFPIKNTNRVGVSYVINEEIFHTNVDTTMKNRDGSSLDKLLMEETMASLNYAVHSDDDLDSVQIFQRIMYVIENYVDVNDSVFMITILSHGTDGYVYTVDWYKIKIEDIKNFVSYELWRRNINIPKVLVLQCCQDEDGPGLTADGPVSRALKSEWVTCYATTSQLQAHRCFDKYGSKIPRGSIYVKVWCYYVKKYGRSKHILEILTKINNAMDRLFGNSPYYDQVSDSRNSLTKDLYLQTPDQMIVRTPVDQQ